MSTYSAAVAWGDEDGAYVAVNPEFPGMSGIGATAAEAVAEMETAIETYRAKGWPLPVPRRLPAASGTCLVRLPRTLHARLVLLAAQGVSLNALVTTLLAEAVGVASSERRVV